MCQRRRREIMREIAEAAQRPEQSKSQRRRKGQSSRKRHRQKRSWRRCGGVARTGVAVEASRGVAEASQRRYERALMHEQSEERLTIVHLAYPWVNPWAVSESGSSCECTGSVSMRCVVVVCSRQDHSSISCADALFGGSLGHVGPSFDHSALLRVFRARRIARKVVRSGPYHFPLGTTRCRLRYIFGDTSFLVIHTHVRTRVW